MTDHGACTRCGAIYLNSPCCGRVLWLIEEVARLGKSGEEARDGERREYLRAEKAEARVEASKNRIDDDTETMNRHASMLVAAVEAEREACAQIAAGTVCAIPPPPHTPGVRCGCDTANGIAAAIRARGPCESEPECYGEDRTPGAPGR